MLTDGVEGSAGGAGGVSERSSSEDDGGGGGTDVAGQEVVVGDEGAEGGGLEVSEDGAESAGQTMAGHAGGGGEGGGRAAVAEHGFDQRAVRPSEVAGPLEQSLEPGSEFGPVGGRREGHGGGTGECGREGGGLPEVERRLN